MQALAAGAMDAESGDRVIPKVDLVVLTRTSELLHREVERGIRSQHEVQILLHRVVGRAQSYDGCRWETISRARNEGKRRGAAAWLMFLDDDVVLAPGCISLLVRELSRRSMYGALAADYLGECRKGPVARHVTMGATLFRREALDQISFRWREERCECQCCCDDLRRLRWAIDYCPSAKARHLSKGSCSLPLGEETSRVVTAQLGIERCGTGQFKTFISNPILVLPGDSETLLPSPINPRPSRADRTQSISSEF